MPDSSQDTQACPRMTSTTVSLWHISYARRSHAHHSATSSAGWL